MGLPIRQGKSEAVYDTNQSGTVIGYRIVDGRRQPPPYDQSSYYYKAAGTTTSSNGYTMAANATGADVNSIPGHVMDRAYQRFLSKARENAELGASIAEGVKSYEMIAKRMTQLIGIARAVKRGDLASAMYYAWGRLAPGPQRKRAEKTWRTRTKSFAGNYMEFHFGWSPLVADVYNAVDVLQSPIKSSNPRGRATWLYHKVDPPWGHDLVGSQMRVVTSATGTVVIGARISVENSNLWLANQLGLINPASIAWELIPFSFVVDWFVNVGNFLSAPTQLDGLKVEAPFTTRKVSGTTSASYKYWPPGQGDYYMRSSSISYRSMMRQPQVVLPKLGLKQYNHGSWRRALAQASLLTRFLSAHA